MEDKELKITITVDEFDIVLHALQTASITRYFNDETKKEFKDLLNKLENE